LRKADLNYPKSLRTNDRSLKNTVYIALGSNKGDRINYLREAVSKISHNPKIILKNSSSVYETKPYGKINQSNFLNAVIEIKTSYNLLQLFDYLKTLEIELDRNDTTKWGPREIDLDLLFFNDRIFKNDNLTVPHYGIPERDFVLVPLKEIAPEYFHPVLKRKISDICNKDNTKNIIKKTRLKIN
jgi:2-amino-4-hydroxy-6-hydroxymethyldihydropteridine diphosphokinase